MTLLGASALFKGWLSWRTWQWARLARRARVGDCGVEPYRGNARGAMIATGLAGASSIGMLVIGCKLAGYGLGWLRACPIPAPWIEPS